MGDALHTHGGVTSAAEARLAQAGLLAVQGPGLLDARTGVLHGPGSTALVTGTADTAPMAVLVAPHQWLTSRGAANGPYLGALEAARRVSIAAAPASGSRIDVVYVKQNDATPGIPTPDGTTGDVYAVAQGTVGGGKPAIPLGAEELATVTVPAGATRTDGTGVVIANTARQTVPRGVRVPVRNQAERDALTPFLGLEVLRLDTGTVEMWSTLTNAWFTTINPGAWTAYTPSWTTNGSAPGLGNGTLIGRYMKTGRMCEVDIYLKFGTTTGGGTNLWRFSLPFPAAAGREHHFSAKAFTAAGDFTGFAFADSGGSTLFPYLPVSATRSDQAAVRNADLSGNPGTGVPAIAGQYTFGPNHNFVIFGRYETST